MKIAWTSVDEKHLQDLLKRKQVFGEKHGAALHSWVRDYLEQDYALRYVEILKAHAGTVRDLLEPFDDGTRVPQVQERE